MEILPSIVLFILSLFCSFLFSGFETGYLSWNRVKVDHYAESGGWVYQIAAFLNKNPTTVLPTVLLGNNFALVCMSYAFSAAVTHIFGEVPESVINTALAFGALFFCEVMPKSLFRIYSFRVTMRVVPLIWISYIIFYPFSRIVSILTGRGGAQLSSRELLFSLAAEGERHRKFSSSFVNSVGRILEIEEWNFGRLISNLEPIAVFHAHRWEFIGASQFHPLAGELDALRDECRLWSENQSLKEFLASGELFSRACFFVEEGGMCFCFSQEELLKWLHQMPQKIEKCRQEMGI